jgi:hypothetical protein
MTLVGGQVIAIHALSRVGCLGFRPTISARKFNYNPNSVSCKKQ